MSDIENEPSCKSCGVPWVDHMGIMGICAENAKLHKENAKLRKERDAARREVCYCHPESAQFAINRNWDCFKEESK